MIYAHLIIQIPYIMLYLIVKIMKTMRIMKIMKIMIIVPRMRMNMILKI